MPPFLTRTLAALIIFLCCSLLPARALSQDNPELSQSIYVRSAVGRLTINHVPETEPYDVYFNVPVAIGPQVPIFFEFDSPNMTDYRFIRLEEPNTVICARLIEKDTTHLYWTAWVLIGADHYEQIPAYVPLPDTASLPQEVKKWLQPTDIVQSDNQMIIDTALMIKGSDTNLRTIATSIAEYCGNVPAAFGHLPIGFDAYYTLNWGNSCTGHAHLGAALFRALGIPARSLQCIPVWYPAYMDMHWMIDYYVPEYGWVKLESTMGNNFTSSQSAVINLVSNPQDEFPLYYIGIDGYWHTSDPALTMHEPSWGQSHRAYQNGFVHDEDTLVIQTLDMAREVFEYYTATAGIRTSEYEDSILTLARAEQEKAVQSVTWQLGYPPNMDSLFFHLGKSLEYYHQYDLRPVIDVYFEDFEGSNTWQHGGTKDEWEPGIPSYNNIHAHSGQHCYGTDLDDTYDNNADNWLETPSIDLSGLSCAYFSFWVWNDVHDCPQGCAYDPLWMEISPDNGKNYIPYSSHMAGATDDAAIPRVGGWSQVVHDLTPYIDMTVKIRFRFTSNNSVEYAGSYIDDVLVYGREYLPTGMPDGTGYEQYASCRVYPNPGADRLLVETNCQAAAFSMYDLQGRQLIHHKLVPGINKIPAERLSPGLYIYRVTDSGKPVAGGKWVKASY